MTDVDDDPVVYLIDRGSIENVAKGIREERGRIRVRRSDIEFVRQIFGEADRKNQAEERKRHDQDQETQRYIRELEDRIVALEATRQLEDRIVALEALIKREG